MENHRQYLQARRRGLNYYNNGNAFQHFQQALRYGSNQTASYYNNYQYNNPRSYNAPAWIYGNSAQYNYGSTTQYHPARHEQPLQVSNKRKGPFLPTGMNECTSLGIPPVKKPVYVHPQKKPEVHSRNEEAKNKLPQTKSQEISYAKSKEIIHNWIQVERTDEKGIQNEKSKEVTKKSEKVTKKSEKVIKKSVTNNLEKVKEQSRAFKEKPRETSNPLKEIQKVIEIQEKPKETKEKKRSKATITSTPCKTQIKIFPTSDESVIIIDDNNLSKNSNDTSGIGSLENADLSNSIECINPQSSEKKALKSSFKCAITSTPIVFLKAVNATKKESAIPKNGSLIKNRHISIKAPNFDSKTPEKTDKNSIYTAKKCVEAHDSVISLEEISKSCNEINMSGVCEVVDFSKSLAGLSLICNANDTERELNDITLEAELLSSILVARESFYEYHQQQPIALNNVSPNIPLNLNNVYVIVDTNIFIDRMQTVINIMDITYEDNSEPVIYIPWMVIQELDYFKDGYSISTKHPISEEVHYRSRKAVKFINECLVARKSNFKGQPVQRAAENRHKTADDSILACCMQLFGEGYDVVLLSSDTNLRNKAMISNVKAFSPNDIIKELKKKSPRHCLNFVEEVTKKLGAILSTILSTEMKKFYGDRSFGRKSFKSLPWRFRDAVRYLREHFRPVFDKNVPKQCRKVIDDLHELLVVNEAIVNQAKYLETCLALLIYFQNGLPKWEEKIQDTIEQIKHLEKKYLR